MLFRSNIPLIKKLVDLWSIGGNPKDWEGEWKPEYDFIMLEIDHEYLYYQDKL
jgi:hypothetical protein